MSGVCLVRRQYRQKCSSPAVLLLNNFARGTIALNKKNQSGKMSRNTRADLREQNVMAQLDASREGREYSRLLPSLPASGEPAALSEPEAERLRAIKHEIQGMQRELKNIENRGRRQTRRPRAEQARQPRKQQPSQLQKMQNQVQLVKLEPVRNVNLGHKKIAHLICDKRDYSKLAPTQVVIGRAPAPRGDLHRIEDWYWVATYVTPRPGENVPLTIRQEKRNKRNLLRNNPALRDFILSYEEARDRWRTILDNWNAPYCARSKLSEASILLNGHWYDASYFDPTFLRLHILKPGIIWQDRNKNDVEREIEDVLQYALARNELPVNMDGWFRALDALRPRGVDEPELKEQPSSLDERTIRQNERELSKLDQHEAPVGGRREEYKEGQHAERGEREEELWEEELHKRLREFEEERRLQEQEESDLRMRDELEDERLQQEQELVDMRIRELEDERRQLEDKRRQQEQEEWDISRQFDEAHVGGRRQDYKEREEYKERELGYEDEPHGDELRYEQMEAQRREDAQRREREELRQEPRQAQAPPGLQDLDQLRGEVAALEQDYAKTRVAAKGFNRAAARARILAVQTRLKKLPNSIERNQLISDLGKMLRSLS
jgi:hypothetical protein